MAQEFMGCWNQPWIDHEPKDEKQKKQSSKVNHRKIIDALAEKLELENSLKDVWDED